MVGLEWYIQGSAPAKVTGCGLGEHKDTGPDLQSSTVLKGEAQVTEVADYTACSCLSRFRAKGKPESTLLLFPGPAFLVGVENL